MKKVIVREEIITYTCDVCASEDAKNIMSLQVIFDCEKTEGRTRKNYLTNENVDLCKKCESLVLSGNYLFGTGAQGIYKYWFKAKGEE